MMCLPTVCLRTDRVMDKHFDFLSALITHLTNSTGGLCVRGGLLFKNPGWRL